MGALRNIGMLTRYTQWANQRIDQALEPEPEQKVPCPAIRAWQGRQSRI